MIYTAFTKRPSATQGWMQTSDLALQAEAFIRCLRAQGYARGSISQYVECALHFGYWIRQRHGRIADINEQLTQRFINVHLPRCRCAQRCQRSRHMVRAALRQLLTFLRSAGHVAPSVSVDPDHIERELTEFSHYLTAVRGLASSTQSQRLLHIRAFLRMRFLRSSIQVTSLRPTQVSDFVLAYAEHWAPSSMNALGNSLRSYLRYRTLCGDATLHLVAAIPRIAQWRMANVPKWLSADEVKKLLGAFDRDTPVGRRDYAITRCFVDIGLRTTEVARLRLEDLVWSEGTIHIRGKGRRIDLLPLPSATGRAIVDYLCKGRPATTDRGLFVRHRPPIGKPITSGIVRSAVRYAARRGGVKQCINGPHVLRHTVAQRLLQGGSTLKQIADLLRHRCLDTTSIYAKVDITGLRRVALAWPGS